MKEGKKPVAQELTLGGPRNIATLPISSVVENKVHPVKYCQKTQGRLERRTYVEILPNARKIDYCLDPER